MGILSMRMLVMVGSLLEVLPVDGEQRDDHPILWRQASPRACPELCAVSAAIGVSVACGSGAVEVDNEHPTEADIEHIRFWISRGRDGARSRLRGRVRQRIGNGD